MGQQGVTAIPKASSLPTLAELYSDNIEQATKLEQFTVLLNQPPKPEWVKKHPFIKDYYYLPADKVEYLLKALFKEYKIEITGQGTAFNGVWVTVRVHYRNPITQEWLFHDGIGAAQLQTAKGTSPADLANINNGALSMAFPIAKTVAIKDACDHFGVLFGSNLNRKDTINYGADSSLVPLPHYSKAQVNENIEKWRLGVAPASAVVNKIRTQYTVTDELEDYILNVWSKSNENT